MPLPPPLLRLSMRSSINRELVWFVLVGATAAATHLGVVAVAVEAGGLAPLLANVVGFLIAFIVSYQGHSRLTFGQIGFSRKTAPWRFFLIAVTGFCLNQAAYAVGLGVFGERLYLPVLAGVILLVAGMTFLLSKTWAFAGAKTNVKESQV